MPQIVQFRVIARFDEPAFLDRDRRLTHDGVPRSRFLWKKGVVETPSGQRFRVTGRPARCGIMTCATSAKYPMISDFVVPVAGYRTLRRWVRLSR